MARRRKLDDDVPRLPRGRGLALSFGEILRILMVAVALVALLVLQKPCARSVSKFVTDFAPDDAAVARPPGDAGTAAPLPGTRLRTDMTPAELEAAIAAERARALGVDAGVDSGVAQPVADAGLGQ